MSKRILVVDDESQFERLILQRFRRQVRDDKYEFVFALHGIQALEILDQDPEVQMVLTDINMPKMDGLTLLTELKDAHPSLKTIVVSAYGDMPNIRSAMNLGAFDFVTKPIDFTDLETTIDKTLEEVELMQQAAQAQELSLRNTQLQELDQVKTQFFTNISHEFRTPLTVISGMAAQMEENPDKWFTRGLRMIKRNTRNLLDLVNQILDLRKLESGHLQLHLSQQDIVPFLFHIFESFSSVAESRDIQMHFLDNVGQLHMAFDPRKLTRICTNLLGNALKYTAEGDQIYFQLDRLDHELRLHVKDTGKGIPEDQLAFIFDRFYQVPQEGEAEKPGTGIGLSLVRELIRFMGGSITVKSELGKGSTFSVQLPIQHAKVQHAPPPPSPTNELNSPLSTLPEQAFIPTAAEEENQLPRVLVVEDHPDVAQYILSCLEGRYDLAWAKNGQEGEEMAFEHIPDLVLSDVMMPVKNGFELCKTLKSDPRTDHIPVILLTAKADEDARLEGFGTGADAYVAKPFEKRELLIRLEKLLELRTTLQRRYRSSGGTLSDEEPAPEPEHSFVTQIRQEIMANIEDENFGILELCRAIGMSRTQLHRKLKAITGRSTSSFVRSIRLNKAMELLKNSDLNISQVAFEVGFKDPKYFSRTFSEEFGKSPKQLRQSD